MRVEVDADLAASRPTWQRRKPNRQLWMVITSSHRINYSLSKNWQGRSWQAKSVICSDHQWTKFSRWMYTRQT